MLKVSDAFHQAFSSPTRQVLAKVTMNSIVYDNNDLFSVEYDGGSVAGESFNIGSTFSNGIKITFSKIIERIKQLDKIKLEIGIVLPDDSTEFVSMGYFFVESYDPQRNENRTVIEAFDRMSQLGGKYTSKLSYPAKIQDVALEIANKAGVVVNESSFERLSQNKIKKIEGLTYRQAIGIIAQFSYGYAIFDRNGQLDIRMLKDPNFTITTADYFSRGLTKNETMYALNGINCRVSTKGSDSTEEYILQSGSDKGNQISLENNVMTQIYLDDIYQKLKTLNYYPFTLSWRGNPAIEAGDWLSMKDITGKVFKIPNLNYRLNFSGGLRATSSANTNSVAVTSTEYKGTLHQKVEALEGWRNASGGWSYTQVQEPKNPQEGDVWYKPNGPDTELWVYEEGEWVLKTSTAKNRELEDKIDKAKEENDAALADLDKQLSDAQTAIDNVDAANDAVVKAVDQAQEDIKSVDDAAAKALAEAMTGQSMATIVKNDLENTKTVVSQLSDSITLAVQKDDVINQINVSTEGILIAGEKVHITGTTLIDDAIITTAMIKELDASVITTGTLAANLIVPTAGNMLMNSEFQSNTFFDGWVTSGSNPATFYDSASKYIDEYGGYSYAAGINSIGNGSTTSQWRRLKQDVRGRANFPYSASAMMLSSQSNGGRVRFALLFLDSAKEILSTITSSAVPTNNTYTLMKIENAKAPETTAYVRFEYQALGETKGYVTRAMLNRGAKVLPYTASTGQVIVGSDMIVDGAIIAKHLSAESVTAEKLAVGAVNMGSAVVTGILDANRINVINLDASQIKAGTLNAATVKIINMDASSITAGTLSVAVQINAKSIVAGTLNAKLLTGDTAHLNSVDTGNITNSYDYHLQISSKGLFNKTTNVGQLNLHSTKSGGTDWDAAFPGSMTYHFETSTNGQNTGLRFWKNHIMSMNKDQNTGLYLNPYGGTQVRVTSRTNDNTYLAINASAFNVASDRRFKSDIKDYEEDALSIINDLRIRTYKKSGKREIGVIADEAPDNLLLKDETGDMLSLYDYSSIAIKAIQELTDEVDSLKSQIEKMERKIA